MIKSLLISSLTLIHFIGIVICQSHDIFGNYQLVYPSLLSNGSEFDGGKLLTLSEAEHLVYKLNFLFCLSLSEKLSGIV